MVTSRLHVSEQGEVQQLTAIILVPSRASQYGQSSNSKFVESVGGVHSQEETRHWQFNSTNESLAI